jgi:hypothetical protein
MDGETLRRQIMREVKETMEERLVIAKGDFIHTAIEIVKYDYPSVFMMLPTPPGEAPAKFKDRIAYMKRRAEGLLLDRSEIHCLCEFRMRGEGGVVQPCWHPTNVVGGRVEVAELNSFVKKVGPALKATAVVLQVAGVALNLAGIPFPNAKPLVEAVSGYLGQAQGYLGNIKGLYDGISGEQSDEEVLDKIKKEGPGSFKPKPLDGEALVAMKKLFGDTAVNEQTLLFPKPLHHSNQDNRKRCGQ